MINRGHVLTILSEIRDDINYESEENLLSNHVIDSLDLISIITALQNRYSIRINYSDIIPENFDSVDKLKDFIIALGGNDGE